jgi:hypothetical protein
VAATARRCGREHGIPRLLDSCYEGIACAAERPWIDRPEDAEFLVGCPNDHQGIRLQGRYAENAVRRDQVNRIDAEPLPAGIERGVVLHGRNKQAVAGEGRRLRGVPPTPLS